MDLLFKRYASPFLLIDQMIVMSCFADFILETVHKDDDDALWQFYLNKVDGKTFNDFKDEVIVQNTEVAQENLETTINYSINLLQKFNPQ